MEHLRVLQHVLSVIDKQLTRHQHEDRGDRGRGGLGVEREDLVHDFGEWKALRDGPSVLQLV